MTLYFINRGHPLLGIEILCEDYKKGENVRTGGQG